MSNLFESVAAGEIVLKNRIVMAPLTRQRAHEARVPNALMKKYYVQRASAGLILTEATAVTPMGVGYANTPGIWNEQQVVGWKEITQAVHQAGGQIVLQLWHVGRISDPSFLNGEWPVAPSAVAPDGHVSLVRPIKKFETPRELQREEIVELVETFRQASENAKRAGFDGVEIHGANGYLPDQFLQSKTNLRTDDYGGSLENRARFLLEITDAAISVWGAGRVGVHLSPRGDSNSIGDANPRETFTYVAAALKTRKIAFIYLREKQGDGYLTPEIKKIFGGHIIANEGLTPELGQQLLDQGIVDSISFGRMFISNPDLVKRIELKIPLQPFDTSTFYSAGEKGYTDYRTAAES